MGWKARTRRTIGGMACGLGALLVGACSSSSSGGRTDGTINGLHCPAGLGEPCVADKPPNCPCQEGLYCSVPTIIGDGTCARIDGGEANDAG